MHSHGFPCWARGQHIWYNQYLPYFLRQALKMILRLTNSGRLVGQPSQGFSCLCLPKCWDDRYASPTPLKWVVGIWTQVILFASHTLYWLTYHPQTLFEIGSHAAQAELKLNQYGADNDSELGIFLHPPPQMLELYRTVSPHVLLFWLKFLFFDNLFMCFNHIHPVIFISLPMNLLFPITSLLSCMHVTHWV